MEQERGQAVIEGHIKLLEEALKRVFGEFDHHMLERVLPRFEWVELVGGQVLFHQDERDDTLYFVISGRLRATRVDEDDEHRVLGDITRGESVGELAFFTGEPRTATVSAVRDTLLARIRGDVFRELLVEYPLVSLNLTRLVIQRSRREGLKKTGHEPVTFGLVAGTPGIDLRLAARQLAGEMAGASVQVVTSQDVDAWLGEPGAAQTPPGDMARSARLAHKLEQVEADNRYVFFIADAELTEWTRRCTRHADRVLVLADFAGDPKPGRIEQECLHAGQHAEHADTVLVLLHGSGNRPPSGTARWLEPRKLTTHLHVRRDRPADWGRAARVVSGRAVGLVLSGGGARGFAHLGVMKALQEAGQSWDIVGGTSMGSAMGAYAGMDLPVDEAIRLAREAFRQNPTGDYNILPVVALISGGRLRRIIDSSVHSVMGEGCGIEDLWKTYFCVSTNYSAAREAVLTRGPLAKSIRASVAIPGALPPVMLDGELHIDGGTFNNFPVDVMAGMGTAKIIGVNLLREGSRKYAMDEVPGGMRLAIDKLRGKRHRLPGIVPLLINTTILYSYARQGASKRMVDTYFAPPVHGFGMLDWSKFDRIVAAGYRYAAEQLEKEGAVAGLAAAPAVSAAQPVLAHAA
jgi:NTE family protein